MKKKWTWSCIPGKRYPESLNWDGGSPMMNWKTISENSDYTTKVVVQAVGPCDPRPTGARRIDVRSPTTLEFYVLEWIIVDKSVDKKIIDYFEGE